MPSAMPQFNPQTGGHLSGTAQGENIQEASLFHEYRKLNSHHASFHEVRPANFFDNELTIIRSRHEFRGD